MLGLPQSIVGCSLIVSPEDVEGTACTAATKQGPGDACVDGRENGSEKDSLVPDGADADLLEMGKEVDAVASYIAALNDDDMKADVDRQYSHCQLLLQQQIKKQHELRLHEEKVRAAHLKMSQYDATATRNDMKRDIGLLKKKLEARRDLEQKAAMRRRL